MANFRPAGDEDDFGDFEDDNFILGVEEEPFAKDAPRIIGPVHSNEPKRKPFQNGFSSNSSGGNPKSQEDFRAAAMRGHVNIVEDCLKAGFNVDMVLRCGWTALMYASNSANPKLVKLLLQSGANPNFSKDFYTVLMAACSSRKDQGDSVLECVQALVEAKAEINVRDRYHVSPLMCAAREGHATVVDYLVTQGAEINRQSSTGWTALSWACSKGHVGVVKVLLKHKADVSLKHTDGLTAVHNAEDACNDEILCLLLGKPVPPKVPSNHTAPTTVRQNGHSAALPAKETKSVEKKRPPEIPKEELIPDDKPTTERYGELQVFLCGLDLGHLIQLFKDQQVDFPTFLRFNEQDLIHMGISQIGFRKKILDAIEVVHKKDWESSSLISVQYTKHVGCADAMAMIANISKHLCYIGSTVGYVRDQLSTHPQILTDVRDGTGPRQLHKHTQDALKNVQSLEKEIFKLRTHLTTEMKNLNLDAPDIIDRKSSKRTGRRVQLKRIILCSAVITAVSVLWWKRETVLEHLPQFLIKLES